MGKSTNKAGKNSHSGAKKVDRSAYWKYGKSSGNSEKKVERKS